LERAKEDAALAGVTEGIEWKQGDAEDLPFPDNSFDIVFSSLGHMFTPRPEVAAKELIRVTKEGGRIAFTTWPPEHNVGRFFAAIVKHVPPPPNSPPSLNSVANSVMKNDMPDAIIVAINRSERFAEIFIWYCLNVDNIGALLMIQTRAQRDSARKKLENSDSNTRV
jgi:ubiquinone/menaquinone biosynthesis C-methylase UbiE